MTLQEKIAVMLAAVDGKAIEVRRVGESRTDDRWYQSVGPSWDWASREYRVKPEPKEIYVNEYSTGFSSYSDKSSAERAACSALRKAVLYREVIE